MLLDMTAGAVYTLNLYKNGALTRTMGTHTAPWSGSIWFTGAAQAELLAGDYVEIYLYASTATTTQNNGDISYWDGQRVR
ncbi:hypothetical protein D3C76_1763960 [compost metagenome]